MISHPAPSLRQGPPLPEFIALVALMTSLVALSIDAMLPALPDIAIDLNVTDYRQTQWLITSVIFGMAFGQLLFGSIADAYGRKFAIITGVFLFCLGSLIAMFAANLTWLLVGRVIQGIGVSGPRIATMALVRDQFVGNRMARVMSFVMMVLIIIPMLAPMIGQGVMLVLGWQAIFGMFILLALLAALWLFIRQPETLGQTARRPFSFNSILYALAKSLAHPRVLVFSIIAGLSFGALLAYISTSQAIFQEIYQVGDRFPIYFAMLAFGLGVASLVNSFLVMSVGAERLTLYSLWGMLVIAALLLLIGFMNQGVPPLWSFMVLGFALFFFIGVLFSNVNSLAMIPLGKMAGIGAAVIGSVSNLVGVLLSALIGWFFTNTLTPIFIGLFLSAVLSIFLAHTVRNASDDIIE